MKATRFMRQPFYVAGYLVTEDNMDAIAKWCEGHVIRDVPRPFIRVPVDRATHKRQTEAYPGLWVLLSKHRDENSFKVYTPEWLEKNFIRLPDDELGEIELEESLVDSNGNHTPPGGTTIVVNTPGVGTAALFQSPVI